MTTPADAVEQAVSELDTSRPHPARVYDYLLDGKDNYAADRAAAEQILKVAPEAKDMARANRAFLARSVRFLAAERGIRQFLDIGTGIPTAGSTHEVAQAEAPESRVVYVDNDPYVLAHARALLVGTPQGATDYIHADLRDPQKILAGAARTLDFTKPAALLLVAILHFIPDDDNPAGLVAACLDALPAGSFLVLSHGTADFHAESPEATATATAVYDTGPAPLVLRPEKAVKAFFDGLTLEPPGLVRAPLWRPDGRAPTAAELAKLGIYAAVAKK